MPIYCDESGYTGTNLLVEVQPYFVYSAINIEETIAKDYVAYLKEKYFLQGELKGSNLVKSSNGQKAIKELFEKYSNVVKIVFYHKKYALACKFFEYIYEPPIADYNSFFYKNKFHRFVANVVYASLANNSSAAEEIFIAFQELLKGDDQVGLFKLFEAHNDENPLLNLIAQFAMSQREAIINELTVDSKTAYWVLDLTRTALYDLLCLWGEEIGALHTVCDNSEPLKDAVNNWSVFKELNQEIRYWNPFGEGEKPLNFNLVSPIEFLNSKKCEGLQLADMFASSVYSALKAPDTEFSRVVLRYVPKIISNSGNYCIIPEPALMLNPKSREFDFGLVALKYLAEFSDIDPKSAAKKFIEHLSVQVGKFQNNINWGQ